LPRTTASLLLGRLAQASSLHPGDGAGYEWFVFTIRIYVGRGLKTRQKQKPDIENFPKLIVDAFTGILYEDDHLDYVRGIQIEGHWVDDEQECTEVWIWGK
jgi:hypothetical protein